MNLFYILSRVIWAESLKLFARLDAFKACRGILPFPLNDIWNDFFIDSVQVYNVWK